MSIQAPSWLTELSEGYLECCLWSSQDDDGPDLETLEWGDGHRRMAEISVQKWAEENEAALDLASDVRSFDRSKGTVWEHLGHDLWLSQVGHGAGFWDGRLDGASWGDTGLGDHLTRKAKDLGEGAWVYVGDDGLLYLDGMN